MRRQPSSVDTSARCKAPTAVAWTRREPNARKGTTVRVTLYLLAPGAALDATALRAGSGFSAVATKPIAGIKTALFVKHSPPRAMRWIAQLEPLVSDPATLTGMSGASAGAVLLVRKGAETFAVTFGTGFQAIDPDKVERGFGLRVTANAIANSMIKSAETRMLERDGRSQRVILPNASRLSDLGIEPLEEWVRQLTGPVTDRSFAKTASGADSLRLTIEGFSLTSLPKKLAQISALHKATTYQAEFPFLDNFVQLDRRDPRVQALDQQVAGLVQAQSSDVYFAAPEPFEQLAVEGYLLVRRKRVPVADLTQEDVFEGLGKLHTDGDVLNKVSIRAVDVDGADIDKAYRLYDYVQAEVHDNDDRFILSAGRWFQVARDYVEQVDAQLAAVDDITSTLDLPVWSTAGGRAEVEGDYNARVAALKGYALLDKSNLEFERHQRVEVCDLLTPDRHLLCVKRATRSSTLSHLFAQGSVSASLMYAGQYQAKVLDALSSITGNTEAWDDAPWIVTYVIATEKPAPLLPSLFFFSRMNLVKHVADIRSRGIAVAVARVGI